MMNSRTILLFIALVALQVVVLNHILLFGTATPLLLPYAIAILPFSIKRWQLLTAAFVAALLSDMFENTPGMAICALTLTAFLRAPLLRLFVERSTPLEQAPSQRTLGPLRFYTYALLLTALYATAHWALAMLGHWQQGLLWALYSLVLTTLFIITIESVRRT